MKKIKLDKTMVTTTAICLLPIIFGVAVYGELPSQIPTKFGFDGAINGYTATPLFVFGFPIMMAAMNLFFQIIAEADPKKANTPQNMKNILKWLIPFMTLTMVPMSLMKSLDPNLNIAKIVNLMLGVIFIICGNYLPKAKQNYTIGFKLPWTLSSQDNWNKTHRLAGYLWVLGGIVLILNSLILSNPFPINTLILISITAIPSIYSFTLYKKGV